MTELFENYLQREIDALRTAQAGIPVIRKFPFAYNTLGILTGAALYTPTIGDILLDAWIEIDTAWDGTTPKGDVGTFVGVEYGLIGGGSPGIPVDMTAAEDEGLGAGIQIQEAGVRSPFTLSSMNYHWSGTQSLFNKYAPAKFIAANPVKVCVSQDGTTTGATPGSTQGVAVLYLVTATPV